MASTVEIVIKAIDQASPTLKGLATGFENFTGISLSAAGAITAVTAALKFSIDAAAEAEQVDARLTATLKATGGAAGLTAEEIDELAVSYSRLTGQEDEAIKSAANVLLRFQSLNEETFPKALQATLDLSAAMGTDLSSAATQLGRALEDPESGLGALRRAGIVFTDSQKDLIKSMVEAGDIAGAQEAIFEQLDKRIGGTAQAMGSTYLGEIQKFNNELGNMGEIVGGPLIQGFSSLLRSVNATLAGPDNLRKGLEEANKSLEKTAANYDEYRRKALENISAAGYGMSAEAERLARAHGVYDQELQKIISSFDLLNERQFMQINGAERARTAIIELSEAEQLRMENHAIIKQDAEDMIFLTRAQSAATEELADDAARAEVHVKTLFDGLDRDIRSPIAQFISDLKFITEGGGQFLIAFENVKTALEQGFISQEEAAALLQPILAGYEQTLVAIGEQTSYEAVKNVMAAFGVSYAEALRLLQSEINGAELALRVRLSAYWEGGIPPVLTAPTGQAAQNVQNTYNYYTSPGGAPVPLDEATLLLASFGGV